MSTHQLPDGRWICKFPAGTIPSQPKKTKEYFGRGPEGERKAKSRNTELGIGVTSKAASTPIFSTLAQKYLEAKGGSMTESTLSNVMYKLKGTILPFMADIQAHDLNHEFLDKFVAYCRKKGVKDSTTNISLTFVFAIMNHAYKRGFIISNPAYGYGKLKNDGDRIRPPSQPEFDAILKVAAKHLQRVMLLAMYTGIRPGPIEMYGLKYSDIDWYGNFLSVKSALKGGMDRRDIPISSKLMPLLKQWREVDAGLGHGYIIHYGGTKVGRIECSWRTALKRAGVTRRLRPYDLRHMAATSMLSKGADLKAVSQILGHSSPATTILVYQHVINSQRVEAIEKI